MSGWQEFFDSNGDYSVKVRYFECTGDFTVEELYQAFKARMQQERRDEAHPNENCPGCRHDWQDVRTWTDEKGIRHTERKCLKCDELTSIISAIDVHEWAATANQEPAEQPNT